MYLVVRAESGAGPASQDGSPAAARAGRTVSLEELASYAGHRWIGGCERCRAQLIRHCALAGLVPKIAFAADD